MPRPLDCQQILERLEAYVDGDFDGVSAAAVAAHLKTCPGCAAEHSLASDIRLELRTLPAFDTPPAMLREVFRQVGGERFRPPARVRRPAWAALAAAALAAVMIGGGIFMSLQTTTTSESANADLTRMDPEEIARATEAARLAFAHVARVSRQAGFQVRENLGEHLVAASARSLTRALFRAPDPVPMTSTADRSPDPDRS
ncbi:MAG: zf-HC2 domain-containing protein [Thermoanaerobaculia bacterium]